MRIWYDEEFTQYYCAALYVYHVSYICRFKAICFCERFSSDSHVWYSSRKCMETNKIGTVFDKYLFKYD